MVAMVAARHNNHRPMAGTCTNVVVLSSVMFVSYIFPVHVPVRKRDRELQEENAADDVPPRGGIFDRGSLKGGRREAGGG